MTIEIVNDASRNVIDDSRMILQIMVSFIIVIYNSNML
jgi:hypothetical protein